MEDKKIPIKYIATELTEGTNSKVQYACTELTEGGIVSLNSICQCEEECDGQCEASCLSCQYSCEYSCEQTCQCYRESCEYSCEGCESTCEYNCQSCEGTCETNCEKSCMTLCENYCESECEFGCEDSCEGSCESSCMSNCEYVCECAYESCQSSCETSCQNCEGACESASESGSPPPRPSWIALDSEYTDHEYLVVDWERVDEADGYEVYLNGSYYETIYNNYSVIGPLEPNTSYTVCVRAFNDFGTSSFICGTFSTEPEPDTEPPEISNVQAFVQKSGSVYTVRVTWSASDNVGVVKHWAYRTSPNDDNYTSIGVELDGDARSYTFTNDADGNPFVAGNTYSFMIRAVDEAGNISPMVDGQVSVYIDDTRPPDWEWSYNITPGGELYSYSSDNKTAYLMPASEWNEFTDLINQFRNYKGLSSYNFTQASTSLNHQGIKTCINEAISAINEMLSSGQMDLLTDSDYINNASIFINLRDKLNSID